MKKKLEAELISIAHRILKLKNKSEVIQLHQETQKLYEILSVLRFYEENFEEAKPTIGLPELEEKLEETFENKEPETVAVIEEPKKEEPVVTEKEPEAETIATSEETLESVITEASVSEEENTAIEEVVSEPEQEEKEAPVVAEAEPEKVVVGQIDIDENDLDEEEPLIEEEKAAFQEVAEEPVFEPVKEEPKKEAQQITLEDLLGQHTYKEPEFVKVEDVPVEVEKVADITFEPAFESKAAVQSVSIDAEKDAYSRKTDSMGKSISLGLNDRIAFEKNLFGGSGEDLNRVLSQLNSFDNYQDAQNFIEDLVKPDYNNWEGKEEYETRFMEIVEKRFS